MPFAAHLDELRGRLIRVVVVIFTLFIAGFSFLSEPLRVFFLQPHRTAVTELADRIPPFIVNDRLSVLSALEPVFFDLKIAMMVALLVGLPYLLFELWGFIAAGLFKKERKAVTSFLPWSILLALGGMSFGYWIAIPLLLEFLYSMVDQALMIQAYRLSDYFSLFLMFTFASALVFQLPMILLGLQAAGFVDAPFLRKYRRHFILGAFVLGAVFTPPEPFSQFLMAFPTVILYEVGIFLVALRGRKASEKSL